ncbi:hypothetical protein [Sphingomonas lenta]|uniref:hypothetical protein n=1 Tax=Sphingomonas lenta TaxID=1141887 RepID=UPI001140C8F9|nr:hypothetical protein [Sphingomonas lenta]
MIRFGSAFLTSVIMAMPSAGYGQDVLGPVNPVTYTPAITMNAAIRAQAQQRARGPRSAQARTSRSAQTCAELPRFRSHYGAGDRKVQELTRLCRQAGY